MYAGLTAALTSAHYRAGLTRAQIETHCANILDANLGAGAGTASTS